MATVADVFSDTATRFADQPAVYRRRDGKWLSHSWSETHRLCECLASAMIELGVGRGDVVLILSQNRIEWFLTDLAAILAGAVPAGVYATSSADQLAYICDHSKASFIFVEDSKQLTKIDQVRDQLPHLKTVVSFEQVDAPSVHAFWPLTESHRHPKLDTIRESAKDDDVVTLVYTSGTTSAPKAVMLTNRNMTWMAKDFFDHHMPADISDTYLSYLPLSHIAEQMTSIHGPITTGYQVYFAESMERMPANLAEVRPTLFLGVPRVWEKIQARLESKLSEVDGMQATLLNAARKFSSKRLLEGDRSFFTTVGGKLLDKLVLRKIRIAMGLDRCRLALSGAAPISKETVAFFYSLGLPISEAYGMSETTGPISLSIFPDSFRHGAVGKKMVGSQIRIADDGEIMVQGPHIFIGYLHQLDATEEVLSEDGWLATGDTGKIDADGFLYVTGRKKNLIITAGGENVATEMLEDKFTVIPGIEHAVAVGDQRRYISMLLTLDMEHAPGIGMRLGSAGRTPSELARCPKFIGHIEEQVEVINRGLARVQTIKRFKLLDRSFGEDTGELTPTMKVKRAVVLKKYEPVIDQLYS